MKRKTRVKSSDDGSSVGPDIDQIEELLKIMTEHNLEEFEYSRGDLRIRLKKPSSGALLTTTRASTFPEIIVAVYGGFAPGKVADRRYVLWVAEPRRRAFCKDRRLCGRR